VRQHLLQDGGARPAEADDEHRLLDHLILDLGMQPVFLGDPEPRLKIDQEVGAGQQPAERGQLALGLDRFQQFLEMLDPAAVGAEIAEASFLHRLAHQRFGGERDDARDIHHLADLIELGQPFRPRRRGPDRAPVELFVHPFLPKLIIFVRLEGVRCLFNAITRVRKVISAQYGRHFCSWGRASVQRNDGSIVRAGLDMGRDLPVTGRGHALPGFEGAREGLG
jgi:hypothetical protein